MQEKLLFKVHLGGRHPATGRTRHYHGNDLLPEAEELQIVTYDDKEYYLFYFDASGNLLTDTCHQTLRQAFKQAEFEYSVRPDEWEDLCKGPI